MQCLTYARVSTEKQAEKELSIPAQLEAMRDYAQRQGWTVLEEYTEPGASARNTDRPALKQLLARCKREPKVQVVLVHKIDRLARNVYDHATIKAMLKQQGIRLASVVENMDDTVTGQLVENIMASLAQWYAGNLSEEVKKGMTAKIKRGEWPHQPPLGFQMVRQENGRTLAEPDPVTGPLMRQAFELYATGYYSLKQVARELAPKGLITRLGKPLATSQMNLLLRNPFYAGRLRWKGSAYPGAHEPLIAPDLFERVQRQLSAKFQRGATRYGSMEFWLKGIAYCGACGTKMTAERHKGHAYYRCLANARGREHCTAPFSNADRVHASLRRVYKTLALTARAKRHLIDAGRAIACRATSESVYKNRESVVMHRTRLLERQLKAAEAYAAGDLTRETHLALTQRWERELSGLDQQIRSMSVDPETAIRALRDSLVSAESLWDVHASLNAAARFQLAHAVFERIAVKGGNVSDAKVRPALECLLDGGVSSRRLDMTSIGEVEQCVRTILEDRAVLS